MHKSIVTEETADEEIFVSRLVLGDFMILDAPSNLVYLDQLYPTK